MKIECTRELLERAISTAERSTGKNLTLPILSAIILQAKNNKLEIKATNLDLGVEINIPAKVEKEGVVAIKAQTLSGFLANNQTEKTVVLELGQNNIKAKTKFGEATINCLSHDDFPEIKGPAKENPIKIDGARLSDAIKSVIYSASTSQIKPELSSVVMFGQGKSIVFVSTDSFRLAEKKLSVDKNCDFGQVIIPTKNALEIARIAEEEAKKTFELYLSKNQLLMETEGIRAVSRTIEGSFPDYKQIIPKEFKTEAVVLKEDFVRAIKTATVFSDNFNQTTLVILPAKKKMEIRSKNSEVGEGVVQIQAAISGDPLDLSFNHKYIFDCLGSIKSDSLSLSFSGQSKPALVRGVSDNTFQYVVMPMNR